MFESEPFANSDLPAQDAPKAEKEHQWRIWVGREIQRRALLAHYILDGQIAQMSGDPTSTRHAANQLNLPSNDAAFDANNADDWLFQMRSQPTPDATFRGIFRSLFSPAGGHRPYDNLLSSFSLRVILEGLQSLISDCDDLDGAAVGVPSKSEVRRALALTHESITRNTALSAPETLETLLRWHGICLNAATDSSLLCRHICARHNIVQYVLGGGKGSKPGFDLAAWARTEDARRALLHAMAIQDIVEQLPRGRAHVIHMPSSLFAAATVYSAFAMAGSTTVNLPRTVDWKDALFTEVDPCVILGQLCGSAGSSDTRRFVRGEQAGARSALTTTRNLLYELNSMQKLFRCLSSQWGVAFEMEKILDQWISLSH
ncbi:hypothetical protein MBLNU459_g1082t1 [Dothideomycetes sp. NU459]